LIEWHLGLAWQTPLMGGVGIAINVLSLGLHPFSS